GAQTVVLDYAGAGSAQAAKTVGVVNHDPGLAPVRGGADLRQLRQIAIHAEDSIGNYQGIAGGLVQAFAQAVHIIVQVTGKTGAAQQAGVQQGGMIQSILQHAHAPPGRRGPTGPARAASPQPPPAAAAGGATAAAGGGPPRRPPPAPRPPGPPPRPCPRVVALSPRPDLNSTLVIYAADQK